VSLPKPRKCRAFSHTRKCRRRDCTGWLGCQDSNLGMAEIKIQTRLFSAGMDGTIIVLPTLKPPAARRPRRLIEDEV
jgi:hypothetical protein